MDNIPSIAIVEDDESSSNFYASILKHFGVIAITNVYNSGEYFLRGNKQEQLIILDYHLFGKLNGVDVMESLIYNPDIIFISASVYSKQKILDCVNKYNGNAMHLSKPITTSLFVSSVKKYLKQ